MQPHTNALPWQFKPSDKNMTSGISRILQWMFTPWHQILFRTIHVLPPFCVSVKLLSTTFWQQNLSSTGIGLGTNRLTRTSVQRLKSDQPAPRSTCQGIQLQRFCYGRVWSTMLRFGLDELSNSWIFVRPLSTSCSTLPDSPPIRRGK